MKPKYSIGQKVKVVYSGIGSVPIICGIIIDEYYCDVMESIRYNVKMNRANNSEKKYMVWCENNLIAL